MKGEVKEGVQESARAVERLIRLKYQAKRISREQREEGH
jgi:hypothetical protein